MLKRNEIRIRDPFIVLYNDTYFLYATKDDSSLSYYKSTDLENFEESGICFSIPEDFWAMKDVWAAEVHKYKGRFYLFVSLLGKSGLRGTQIAVANTPEGPFIPIKNGPATPENQSCIDGTLFLDGDTPYIVYSHDWTSCYNKEKDCYIGEICAARLSDDLTDIVGEPTVLFRSVDVPLSNAAPAHTNLNGKTVVRYGSDAPFVQRLSEGKLLLTWSPYLTDNYVVLGAISESGNIFGPWRHLSEPVFKDNGGHAMFFEDKKGRRCMCLHAPEIWNSERAHLFVMKEKNNTLEILKEI